MKHLVKIIILALCWTQMANGENQKQIQEFPLDEHTVYPVAVSTDRVTTISFPGPISAIDAAQVTVDGKTPGLFQIAHTKGSFFFSVRALAKGAASNINVRWNNKTYVLEITETNEPVYSVIFESPRDLSEREEPVTVTPNRLLALLDKAKAYPVLKQFHPEAVADVEYKSYAKTAKPQKVDYKTYEVQIEEAFRFNPEDTLIFRLILRNKTDQPLQYQPDGFSLKVGERLYPQSISDASGVIPPHSEMPAYFAVSGTPDGGRNEISLKNDFSVVLEAYPAETKSESKK